jgi:hypothetical protein
MEIFIHLGQLNVAMKNLRDLLKRSESLYFQMWNMQTEDHVPRQLHILQGDRRCLLKSSQSITSRSFETP